MSRHTQAHVALFIVNNMHSCTSNFSLSIMGGVAGWGSRPWAGIHVFWLANNHTEVNLRGIKLGTSHSQGEGLTSRPSQLPLKTFNVILINILLGYHIANEHVQIS